MINQFSEEIHPYIAERVALAANNLFTMETVAHPDHRLVIPILRVHIHAEFLLGAGRVGMSYWVYAKINCHYLKNNDFYYINAYLYFLSVIT